MTGRWDPASSPCDADFPFVKIALETINFFYLFIVLLLFYDHFAIQTKYTYKIYIKMRQGSLREPKGANKACV